MFFFMGVLAIPLVAGTLLDERPSFCSVDRASGLCPSARSVTLARPSARAGGRSSFHRRSGSSPAEGRRRRRGGQGQDGSRAAGARAPVRGRTGRSRAPTLAGRMSVRGAGLGSKPPVDDVARQRRQPRRARNVRAAALPARVPGSSYAAASERGSGYSSPRSIRQPAQLLNRRDPEPRRGAARAGRLPRRAGAVHRRRPASVPPWRRRTGGRGRRQGRARSSTRLMSATPSASWRSAAARASRSLADCSAVESSGGCESPACSERRPGLGPQRPGGARRRRRRDRSRARARRRRLRPRAAVSRWPGGDEIDAVFARPVRAPAHRRDHGGQADRSAGSRRRRLGSCASSPAACRSTTPRACLRRDGDDIKAVIEF